MWLYFNRGFSAIISVDHCYPRLLNLLFIDYFHLIQMNNTGNGRHAMMKHRKRLNDARQTAVRFSFVLA